MKVFKSAMSKSDSSSVLVVAGGYDEEVTENVEYLQVSRWFLNLMGMNDYFFRSFRHIVIASA